MAIFYLKLKPLAADRAHAAAAYRARETLRDGDGRTWPPQHDPRDLRAKGIVLPRGAPSWAADRAALWTAATDAERIRKRGPHCGELRRRARAGRSMILALPCELTDAQRRALALDYARRLADRYAVAADWAIHAPDPHGDQRNHHLHLAITDRRLGAGGFGEKAREFTDRKKGPEEVAAVRGLWEEVANLHLSRAGRAEQIDCRTLVAQGIRRPPTKRRGVAGAMARRRPEDCHATPYIGARATEVREGRRRALLDLARLVRLAQAAELAEQARTLWRQLLANARDALREPTVAAKGYDALALAQWAQRTEAKEAEKEATHPEPLAKQSTPVPPPLAGEERARRNRELLDRVAAGRRADGSGPRPVLPVPIPAPVLVKLWPARARAERER